MKINKKNFNQYSSFYAFHCSHEKNKKYPTKIDSHGPHPSPRPLNFKEHSRSLQQTCCCWVTPKFSASSSPPNRINLSKSPYQNHTFQIPFFSILIHSRHALSLCSPFLFCYLSDFFLLYLFMPFFLLFIYKQ